MLRRTHIAFALVAILIVALGLFVASCTGTREAYKAAAAAENPVLATAYVFGEQYLATVRAVRDSQEAGLLVGADSAKADHVIGETWPPVRDMTRVAAKYQLTKSAENEAELQAALDAAALALAKLIKTWQEVKL